MRKTKSHSKNALSPGWHIVAISNAAAAATTTSILASRLIFWVWGVCGECFLRARVSLAIFGNAVAQCGRAPTRTVPEDQALFTQSRAQLLHVHSQSHISFSFAYLAAQAGIPGAQPQHELVL
jgi:hypothetical protein